MQLPNSFSEVRKSEIVAGEQALARGLMRPRERSDDRWCYPDSQKSWSKMEQLKPRLICMFMAE
jgi:hypothetical protein